MRMHKYFRRSFTRLHTSSTSFSCGSSFSSSSSSSSFSTTTDGETTKDSNQTKQKRRSWWKHRSFRAKLRKRKERKQAHEKPRIEDNSEQEKNRHDASQARPIPELEQALAYFEIVDQEDFNLGNVRNRYKILCLIHHPDRNGNKKESIHEMQTINHYFDLLQEELHRLEHPSETEDDKMTTPSNESTTHSSTVRSPSKHSFPEFLF